MHPPRVSIRRGLRLQFMRAGCLSPFPFHPMRAYTSRSITLQRGRAIALLRFVSIVPHMFATCASRGFYIKLGCIRFRFPFPVPRSACCVTFVGFVPFLRLLRPRKTLARSYSPFPHLCDIRLQILQVPARVAAASIPVERLLLLLLRLHLARLQRTSRAKVQRILIIANFKCTILHIL